MSCIQIFSSDTVQIIFNDQKGVYKYFHPILCRLSSTVRKLHTNVWRVSNPTDIYIFLIHLEKLINTVLQDISVLLDCQLYTTKFETRQMFSSDTVQINFNGQKAAYKSFRSIRIRPSRSVQQKPLLDTATLSCPFRLRDQTLP